jgi:hypothetical protein
MNPQPPSPPAKASATNHQAAGATHDHGSPDALASIFPNEHERQRYERTLHQLSKHTVSVRKLAERARLTHRVDDVRRALRADVRYEKINARGPERYARRLARSVYA